MKIKKNLALVAVMALAGTLAAGASASSGSKDELTSGEIRRVDKANKGLVIRHEDIKNLQMPAMTMPFRVRQAQMLDGLKDGDKIRFRAEQAGADLIVTEIQVIKR